MLAHEVTFFHLSRSPEKVFCLRNKQFALQSERKARELHNGVYNKPHCHAGKKLQPGGSEVFQVPAHLRPNVHVLIAEGTICHRFVWSTGKSETKSFLTHQGASWNPMHAKRCMHELCVRVESQYSHSSASVQSE